MNWKERSKQIFEQEIAEFQKVANSIGDEFDQAVEMIYACKGKVVIGTNGNLIGNLTCTNAEIMGTTEGTINVSEMLSLKSTAKVKGDIKTKTLMIEPKAIFCGTCDMEISKQAEKK